MEFIFSSLLELVTRTSTNLPPDVRAAMAAAAGAETPGTQSAQALDIILQNIDMAQEGEGAICQDTGMPTFLVRTPVGVNQMEIGKAIREAVAEATRRGKLRPNSVDSITGKNSGNNLGHETPVIHLGCAPGARGVCIGSDRAHGYELAKAQLFRTLDDVNPDPTLAKLEADIMQEANRLGVGAMGFGGKVSLIGCKITAANRLPASFFVSVAYDCWAFRRLGVRLDAASGAITRWLYRDPERPVARMARGAGFPLTGREVVLTAPLTEAQVRALKVGDVVLIDGDMFTGRDNVHAYLMKNPPPVDLNGAALYHCGPVMLQEGGRWTVKAAGPTTSIREEPYQGEVIKRYGVRAVIGKGGMGPKTLAAMKEFGAVYLSAIGGAAQYYARTLPEVKGVYLMEFGIPEAMWHYRADRFPAIVTMDAHGASLHADVEKATGAALEALV
ncbi:MAG: fumarate hydratase [Acidobacteriia bacterium]|nr:fumarate hydratase [Terriglobia bacterium]